LHFKGKKCVLQASIKFKLQMRLKNICFDAAKLGKGCNCSFIKLHLSLFQSGGFSRQCSADE